MKKKLPSNLNLKIGTKAEAAWTRIKDETVASLEAAKRAIFINEAILEVAEKMIAKEKDL